MHALYCCKSVISYSIELKTSLHAVPGSYREGDIRLVEGQYNWEGRVEIYVSRTWSTINDNSWTNSDAEVVCRQLGHLTEGTCKTLCQPTIIVYSEDTLSIPIMFY